MDSIIRIPDEYMTIDYLLKNQLTHKINQEYSIEIKLKKNPKSTQDQIVTNYYEQLIDTTPEILNILNGNVMVIGDSVIIDDSMMLSVIWIYQYYFNYSVVLFLPERMNESFYDSLTDFNESFDPEYELTKLNILQGTLEHLEQLPIKKNQKIVFGYSHIIFNELFNTNKRRLNTILGNIVNKSELTIFTPTGLDFLDLKVFEKIHSYNIKKTEVFNIQNIIESITSCDFDFESELTELTELIEASVHEEKRLYLSLDLPVKKLKEIEEFLNAENITNSRTDSPNHSVVTNSSKTTLGSTPKYKYDIYIYLLPSNFEKLEVFSYFQCLLFLNKELLVESEKPEVLVLTESNYSRLTDLFKKTPKKKRLVVNDSDEYSEYQKMMKKLGDKPVIQANDYYYRLQPNQQIKQMVLSNLKKKDYDSIRHYVKVILETKYSITVNTCQLSTPCSPKDRSTKLNSISNKISSYDYRCDVTCEIFKDYTIGVIVWGETFANRGKLRENELKNETFVFQTTNGNWKYSIIS